MQNTSLDWELEKKRKQVFSTISLDNVNTEIIDKSNMKAAIYKMIDMEVLSIQTEGTYHYKNSMLNSLEKKSLKEKFVLFFKRADKYFLKSDFYNFKVRKILKNIYYYFSPSKTINLIKLLKLDDEELLIKIYQELYMRAPDMEGLQHNLAILQNGTLSKYDLFISMYNMEENVLRKRVRWRRLARIVFGNNRRLL